MEEDSARQAARLLVDIAGKNHDLPLDDLRTDPLEAFDQSRTVFLRYSSSRVATTCRYRGRYDPNPPTIEVTKSASRARDNFRIAPRARIRRPSVRLVALYGLPAALR